MTVRGWLLTATALLVGTAMSWASLTAYDGTAVGPLIRRGVIPGLAADSAPPAVGGVAPTATPSGPLHPVISVKIEMTMNEGSLVEGGTTLVELRTALQGGEPTGSPQAYLTGVVVTAHPTDQCLWEAVFSRTAFEATLVRRTTLLPPRIEINMRITSDPSWYYAITCPGSHHVLPAPPVERTLGGWLGLILGPGRIATSGYTIEIPVYNGEPGCFHNRGEEYASNVFGNVKIAVDIMTPPCPPPPPPP